MSLVLPSKISSILILVCVLCLATDQAIGETTIRGQFAGGRGCTVSYQIHEPEGAPASHPIILTHGFMRDLHTLTDWGTQLSARGFRVVLVSLCNSSWLSGRHEANANDLVALRHHLGFNSVIYGGFSAGGLSAYLAALKDTATAGYIGLDAVDSGNIARDNPAVLQVPALFVTAPASMCNAGGNFERVMARSPSYDVVALTEPNHCSFEMPNDSRCNWICGRLSDEQSVAAQQQIFAAVASWLQLHFSDATTSGFHAATHRLAEDVRFVDPSIDLTGIDAFEANVVEVQGNIHGAVYARTSKVDEQHDFYRYHWAIHQHGELLLQGFDATGLNNEGKVQLVIGFFGELSVD